MFKAEYNWILQHSNTILNKNNIVLLNEIKIIKLIDNHILIPIYNINNDYYMNYFYFNILPSRCWYLHDSDNKFYIYKCNNIPYKLHLLDKAYIDIRLSNDMNKLDKLLGKSHLQLNNHEYKAILGLKFKIINLEDDYYIINKQINNLTNLINYQKIEIKKLKEQLRTQEVEINYLTFCNKNKEKVYTYNYKEIKNKKIKLHTEFKRIYKLINKNIN